jgi:hypothetical protein
MGSVARCDAYCILHKGFAGIPTLDAFSGALSCDAGMFRVQDRGAVAFVRAGTLELEGNTITNTESTAVRGLPLRSQWLRVRLPRNVYGSARAGRGG